MSRDQLAFKLYKYEDKITRYESHKEFLSRCVKEKVIPRGLKVEVEPTIGNHDEEFVSLWNEKLKSLSLELMKDIITFCEKTLTSTTAEKHKVDSSLKKETEILEYRTIKHTINKNVEATRNNCQKRKAKQFSNLKYSPPRRQFYPVTQPMHSTTPNQNILRMIPTYADTVKTNLAAPRTTNTNQRPSEAPKSLSERIRTFHDTSRRQREKTSVKPRAITRKPGSTRLLQRPTETRPIVPCQLLKEQLNQQTYYQTSHTSDNHQQIDTENLPTNPKNVLAAPMTSGGLEVLLSALNQNTQVIIDFGRFLKQVIEQ